MAPDASGMRTSRRRRCTSMGMNIASQAVIGRSVGAPSPRSIPVRVQNIPSISRNEWSR